MTVYVRRFPTPISGRPSPSKSAMTGALPPPMPGSVTRPPADGAGVLEQPDLAPAHEHDLRERIGVEVRDRGVSVRQESGCPTGGRRCSSRRRRRASTSGRAVEVEVDDGRRSVPASFRRDCSPGAVHKSVPSARERPAGRSRSPGGRSPSRSAIAGPPQSMPMQRLAQPLERAVVLECDQPARSCDGDDLGLASRRRCCRGRGCPTPTGRGRGW